MLKFIKLVSLSLATVLTLSVCSVAGKSTDADTPQKIVFALQNQPDGIDPGITNNSFAAPFLFNLFEGLVTYDRDNNLVPGLAEEWDISADGLTYTFKLREGLKWSNGEPLTANDFVYSYFRVLDPATTAQYVDMITDYITGAADFYAGEGSKDDVGITAPDDNTLVLELSAPAPYFLGILGMWTFFPVNQAVIEAAGDRWTMSADTYVCNGPFMISDIKLGESVTLVKNPNYWDESNVKLEEIVMRYILEPSTALTALESGQIDGFRQVPAAEIPRLRSSSDAFQIVPSFATTFYLINNTEEIFKDERVRKALSMAIDRTEIIENVLQTPDQPAYGLVSPGYVVDGVDFKDDRSTYGLSPTADVEGAKALLAEAGYPDGEGFPTIELGYYTDATVKKVVETMQQMWSKNLNINTEITTQEWAVYYDAIQAYDYQIGAMGWGGDYLHPMTFLPLLVTGNVSNNSGYSNPEYDELVAQAQKETDPNKAMTIMKEAEDMAMSTAPLIPLYHRSNTFMMASYVKGYYMTPLSNLYFKEAYVEK